MTKPYCRFCNQELTGFELTHSCQGKLAYEKSVEKPRKKWTKTKPIKIKVDKPKHKTKGLCLYCKNTFKPVRSDQKFCCDDCRFKYHSNKNGNRNNTKKV